jgi:hypothetical protein
MVSTALDGFNIYCPDINGGNESDASPNDMYIED